MLGLRISTHLPLPSEVPLCQASGCGLTVLVPSQNPTGGDHHFFLFLFNFKPQLETSCPPLGLTVTAFVPRKCT